MSTEATPADQTPAQRALAQAQTDLRRTLESLYRRQMLPGDLNAAVRDLHYAEWAVTK